jgi:hypothetical protein
MGRMEGILKDPHKIEHRPTQVLKVLIIVVRQAEQDSE